LGAKGVGAVIDTHARCTYYNPSNNDPPGSWAGAFVDVLTPLHQSSPSSIAMGSGSPYKKFGLYTVTGIGGGGTFCVRVEDTCAACTGTHFDIFLVDGETFPVDYC
jgi:hypothetical protein